MEPDFERDEEDGAKEEESPRTTFKKDSSPVVKLFPAQKSVENFVKEAL
jgi:hypothetical protein